MIISNGHTGDFNPITSKPINCLEIKIPIRIVYMFLIITFLFS